MLWCEGKPERERRLLAVEERPRVEAAAHRQTWKAVSYAVLTPGVLLAAPVANLLLEHAAWLGQGLRDVAVPVMGVASIFLGMPAFMLLTRDALRARTAIRRDLRAGEVVLFGERESELGVLPSSALVLARGGVAAQLRAKAAIGEALSVPAGAPTYSLPSAEVPDALRDLAWEKRALANEEKDEIRRHAARMGRPAAWLLVYSTLAAAGLGAALFRARGDPPPALAWLVGLVVLAVAWGRVLSARGARKRLVADAEAGWAVRATTGQDAGDELLPTSGASWTVKGAPAYWRLREPTRSPP